MDIVTTFVWYLVVSAPGGGLVVMPSGFDSRDLCEAAIVEYQKKPVAGWSLACIPAGASFFDEQPEDLAPAQ